jgi:hypothetical protein
VISQDRLKCKHFVLLITALFMVAGCLSPIQATDLPLTASSQNPLTELPTIAAIPVFTPSFTPVPTSTYKPAFNPAISTYAPQIEDSFLTPPPTISSGQVETLIKLLQSRQCHAPCYLSITPGKTTWGDAASIMESLGAGLYREKPGSQIETHLFSFYITDGKEKPTPTNNTGAGTREIDHTISLTVKDDIVQEIGISIQTFEYSAEYTEYWHQYSIKEILLQNGVPDAIQRRLQYGHILQGKRNYDYKICNKQKTFNLPRCR